MAQSNIAPAADRVARPDTKAGFRKAAPKALHSRPAPKLPDLDAILAALFEAHALVSVAVSALAANNHCDLEETVLQMGVDALDVVYDRLDSATVQLALFQEKNAKVRGAA